MSTGDPMPSAVTQQVTATAGFAYGVIGADIHVFGDGSPLYLLEVHQPPPKPDPAWLRELPSRLLNAHTQVVAFTGRHHERDDLHAWREQRPRLAVRWLHAPGGQGKTRLADQIAADAAEAGWKVVSAVQGVGAVRPSAGSQDLRPAGHRGVLVVVDYADRWTVTALTWLLRNALLHQPDVRARVLLLARTTTGWPALRAALQDPHTQASTSEQLLPPLAGDDDLQARRTMFTVARDSFAAIYGLPDPTAVVAPAGLGQPAFGLTLTVHVAALVAVDAHATGTSAPTEPEQLTSYLLDRELQHWTRLYEAGRTHGLDYHTPPSVMTRVAFTAALTGPLPHPDGATLLDALDEGVPAERILVDHTRCYPPIDPVRHTVLEPLYPDRLAEDFVALTLPGPGSESGHAWATTRMQELMQASPAPRRRWWQSTPAVPSKDPPYLARAVMFLTAAAARWPHLGPTHLYPLLRARPQLALTAGGATLATLAALPDVDLTVLEAVETLLPDHRHVDLDIAAAAITGRLTQHRLDATTDPAQRAQLLAAHAQRLYHAGRRDEALTAAEEATGIHRRLGGGNTAAHLPELARSLHTFGTFLSELGRRNEGLTPLEEAADIYRRLAEANPATYLANLANVLNSLGVSLFGLGRRDEALTLAAESVTIYHQLAKANPTAGLPGSALALSNLGMFLSGLGRRDEALTPTQDSVTIYRQLAEANPATYLPDLALALNKLGTFLFELGRAEGLTPVEEAVGIYRRLAEVNPATYLPDLAMSLNNLGIALFRVGRSAEALTPAEEAVSTYRRLVQVNPARHLADLTASLNNLGMLLSALGRHDEALTPTQNSVTIYRELAEANPTAHLPDLAMSLNNLGLSLSGLGRHTEALTAAEKSVAIRRRLAETDPATYLPDLAMSLWGYARICVTGEDNLPEALNTITEAIDHYQLLTALLPQRFAGNLRQACRTRADVLEGLGRTQ